MGMSLLQMNSQSNAGEWLMETLIDHLGGSKTLNQRCKPCVLGAQKKKRLFITEGTIGITLEGQDRIWDETWNESDFNQWSESGQGRNAKLRNSSTCLGSCSQRDSGLSGVSVQVEGDKAEKKGWIQLTAASESQIRSLHLILWAVEELKNVVGLERQTCSSGIGEVLTDFQVHCHRPSLPSLLSCRPKCLTASLVSIWIPHVKSWIQHVQKFYQCKLTLSLWETAHPPTQT